ncbi:MAG: ATP synthase F1 subunit delta [Kiritimatiellae bacterium]|nr:ATP synthase F1 subunit delta [Kiritimatiellia bacterium]MDD5520557.1 ATP synthase F1 subunit delta [Kiritimatiellia bacterium]
MLHHVKAAKRYAKALFDLARETGQIDAVRADLESIHDLLNKNSELALFMRDYMLPMTIRMKNLTALFSGRATPLTFRFIKFVEEKKRCGILSQICKAFVDLNDRMLGIVKGQMTSPFKLDQTDIQSVTTYAQTKTKGRLSLSVVLDPALIGGFRLRLGDVVYDASTTAQLHMLKEKMINV